MRLWTLTEAQDLYLQSSLVGISSMKTKSSCYHSMWTIITSPYSEDYETSNIKDTRFHVEEQRLH